MINTELKKTSMTVCSKCHSIISESSLFCEFCGEKIVKEPSKPKIKVLKIVFFFPIYLVVQIIVAVIFELLAGPRAPQIYSILISSLLTLYIISMILRKDLKVLFQDIKDKKQYLAGFIGFISVLGVSMVWGFLLEIIATAFNLNISTNNNEATIGSFITNTPVISFFLIVIIVPLLEEIVFRASLFESLKRANRVLAYAVSILIFAALHIDFTNFSINELVVIPSYLIGSVALTIIYDKKGLPASILAHTLNNLLSFVVTLIYPVLMGLS
ncbi:MAG: CPBP family intramembrane metalloprotease [Erysipelotrichaceae bacterium]|jgi:membrane protease YdiL (CAAX protease family)|nr:CPBP family intramembrane metalloprotease [Erysipelotrichaceae bacterium]